MDKKEIKEKVSEGWIRINMIFELVGNPKKHIEDTLKDYMANIKTDEGVLMINEDYADTEEVEKGLFTTFVEADMMVLGLEKLTWLCFNFSPASIEISEPVNFNFIAQDLQNWINDLLAQLHEVGAVSKQIASQNKLLVKNMNRLVKNNILLCLSNGISKPKEMEKHIGIPENQIKVFMEALMREGRVQPKGSGYERLGDKPKKESKPKKAKKKPAKKKKK